MGVNFVSLKMISSRRRKGPKLVGPMDLKNSCLRFDLHNKSIGATLPM